MAKRVLLVAMVLVLLAAFMVGAAPKRVLYHYHWTETVYDTINANAVKMFMAKNPGVEVKMVLLPDGDRVNIIRTVLAANGSIDSFALSNGESAEFLGAGQMVPIIPAAFGKSSVDDVVNMWTPGAINTCGGYWDGQYYGVPFELSNYVAWINIADMKEAGLNPAKDKPKTWDQFVEVAKKLVKEEGGTRVRNGFDVQRQGRCVQLPRAHDDDGAAGAGLGNREGPHRVHGSDRHSRARVEDLHGLRHVEQDLGPVAGQTTTARASGPTRPRRSSPAGRGTGECSTPTR